MMLRSGFFRGADDRKRLVPRVGILRSFTRKNWPTVEATIKMNRARARVGRDLRARRYGLKIGCGTPNEFSPSRVCANTSDTKRPFQTLTTSTWRQRRPKLLAGLSISRARARGMGRAH